MGGVAWNPLLVLGWTSVVTFWASVAVGIVVSLGWLWADTLSSRIGVTRAREKRSTPKRPR
jgi:hypothetical protein